VVLVTTFAEDAIAVGEKSSSSASTPCRRGEDICASLSLSLSRSLVLRSSNFSILLLSLSLLLAQVFASSSSQTDISSLPSLSFALGVLHKE